MISLTESSIRASFVNATRKELSDMTLPALDELEWDRLDYLGWHDARNDRRAYAVIPVDDGVVGIVLKQASARAQSRPQCSWCQDVKLPNDVVFFSARRAGSAGRNGGTVGTLVCENFECSANVRKAPTLAYVGFDVEAARDKRIAELQERARNFAAKIKDGD